MFEIHEDDALAIKRHLRVKTIPEDVAIEYSHRMQWALEDGHTGPMGMWPIIDMLKYLDYKPPKKRTDRIQIDWRKAPTGAPVVVSETPDMKGFVGWFEAYQPGGILTVRSPHRPGPIDVFAKFVRPATEDDDISSLAGSMPTGDYEEEDVDEDEMDYVNDEPKESSRPKPSRRAQDDDDDIESEWTASDVGRKVIVEDGDAEIAGIIVGISEDCRAVTVRGEANGEEFEEEYPASIVFPDDPNPVMEAAVAQMAEEAEKKAAKKTEAESTVI